MAEAGEINPFSGDPTAIMLGKMSFDAWDVRPRRRKAYAWKGRKYPDLFDYEWPHGNGEDATMFQTVTEELQKMEILPGRQTV